MFLGGIFGTDFLEILSASEEHGGQWLSERHQHTNKRPNLTQRFSDVFASID